ncbi:hypothetical protein Tco_0259981 [Tanacetum coccineum]
MAYPCLHSPKTTESIFRGGEKEQNEGSSKTYSIALETTLIIIAQPQHQADVHQDELCPPNRRYALMDVNKKVDLENPLCPDEIKEHLLAEEIEKLVEGSENVAENVAEYVDENVEVSSSPPRNDDIQNVLGTKLEPKSDKESPKVEITVVVTSVNDIDEEETPLGKTLGIDETVYPFISLYLSSSSPSHNLSVRNRLLSLFKAKPGQFRHYKSFFQELKVDERINRRISIDSGSHYIVAQGLILEREKSQVDVEKMIADAIQIERENLRSEISSQLNDAIANQIPSQVDLPSVVRPRDEDDPHDGAHPEGENSAKSLGDEHQYHIYQMQNFLKSDVVWESRKEILVPPVQPKPTPKGKSRPEKIALSLHKFPVVNFLVMFIKMKEHSDGIIKTYGELGHEHKFVTEIVARRANGRIVSITESNYKSLNKNDIEDMNTVIWERVHDFQLGVESYQQQVNLTAPTITFPGIEKYKVLSIIFEPIYGIIYKNSKKERGVIRHQEVHNLSKEDVEYLQLFDEEIEERLKCRDQMRIWEMYVNERPLGPRREHPE